VTQPNPSSRAWPGRVLWAAGWPIRAALIALVRLYRATLSGLLGGQCRFHPSCSVYAEDAIRNRGALVGGALAAWRVLRCNPFGRGGVDPAPPPGGLGPYDTVIQTGEAR
jgi:uncharacterized protein